MYVDYRSIRWLCRTAFINFDILQPIYYTET